MTLTKEDVSAVIEKLVDKSLTFGCRVLFRHKSVKLIRENTRFKGFWIGENENGKLETRMPLKEIKILGLQILIGDVLEKMQELENETDWIGENALMGAWRKVGFTKPLQEIAEMIEWEDNIAKPSSATSLFLFLKDILTPPL